MRDRMAPGANYNRKSVVAQFQVILDCDVRDKTKSTSASTQRRFRAERPSHGLSFLGIDAGGTRTVGLLATASGSLLRRKEWGPGNLRLLDDRKLLLHFQQIADEFPSPSGMAVAMAGARSPLDRARLTAVLSRLWAGIPLLITHDLEAAWWSAQPSMNAAAPTIPRVIVLSGTGSCCYGKAPGGRTSKVGGWGHLLGDRGSGYEIGLQGLRAVIEVYDRSRRWPALGARLLRALQFNSPEEFIDGLKGAEKAQVAELAIEVFAAWRNGDTVARKVVDAAAGRLAQDAVACARQLASAKSRIEFRFAGGVLLQQARFAGLVERRLRSLWPNSSVGLLPRESAWGAVELARQAQANSAVTPASIEADLGASPPKAKSPPRFIPPSKAPSPTEQPHPKSKNFDRMSIRRATRLMIAEDSKIAKAVAGETNQIVAAIGLIAKALRRGGRLFYVGAGTSGRLGVLDASECPPTFGASPELVQGVIAGGQTALWRSIEGAEDDFAAGADALRLRGMTRRDVVVGISASGRAAFVWGALEEARRLGAKRVLICFNPNLISVRPQKPDVVITPRVGPELLTGSTRLKAGTATKLILNMLSTLAMVQSGRVIGNLMVDLKPVNEKLKRRAVGILQKLSGLDSRAAQSLLEKQKWNIRSALRQIRSNSSSSLKFSTRKP